MVLILWMFYGEGSNFDYITGDSTRISIFYSYLIFFQLHMLLVKKTWITSSAESKILYSMKISQNKSGKFFALRFVVGAHLPEAKYYEKFTLYSSYVYYLIAI